MATPILIGSGINFGGGITVGSGAPAPAPGVNNITGYLEMSPPIFPGTQLQDPTATINGTTGFTINDDTLTGVAIPALTASNDAWFAANYTVPGFYTCTWGPGSTVASSAINVITLSPGQIVFFIGGQTGPATYNYPFTFS